MEWQEFFKEKWDEHTIPKWNRFLFPKRMAKVFFLLGIQYMLLKENKRLNETSEAQKR